MKARRQHFFRFTIGQSRHDVETGLEEQLGSVQSKSTRNGERDFSTLVVDAGIEALRAEDIFRSEGHPDEAQWVVMGAHSVAFGFRLAIGSLVLSRALAAQSPPPPTASPSAAPPPNAPAEWRLRAPLDSGQVLVEVSSRAAAVTVVTPAGTFLQAFATSRPLAEWANRIDGLRAPGDTAHLVGRVGSETIFTIARAVGDRSGGYVLSGTNGAWTFALKISPLQAGALLGALRGDSAWGAVTYDYPRIGKTRVTDAPHVSGAWLDNQVDRQARPGSRAPRPTYPVALHGTGTAGSVRLLFTVDSTGRVPPESVRLVGTPHPMLARAARDALASARYTPAQRDGRPVAQMTMQDFVFVAP